MPEKTSTDVAPRRPTRLRTRLAILPLVVGVAVVGLPGVPADTRPYVETETVALVAPGAPPAGPGWTQVVDLPIDGQMVGFEWNGRSAGALEVRSRSASGWSPWTDLHGEPDESPNPTSGEFRDGVSVGPLWVGEGATAVEVRVEEGSLPGLRMTALRSVEPEPGFLATPGASAAPAQPEGIITREEWGATPFRTEEQGCGSGPRVSSSGARFMVVHHTVTSNAYGADEADDLIRGIQAFHTEGRDYCDVAYNFLVDRFGRIFEGRAGGIDRAVIGGHAGGFNTASVGVAVLGDFSRAAVPGATREALRRLLTWKAGIHGIDARGTVRVTSAGGSKYPSGQVVDIPAIVGHRDVGVTSCPGDTLYPLLPALRRDVQTWVMLSGPGVTARPVPAGEPRLVTLDGWGGVHQAGGHPPVVDGPFWPFWNIARGVLAQPGGGGYVLDGWGGLHAYGGAAPVSPTRFWPGQDRAQALAAGPTPGSGYVLTVFGELAPFGGAPDVGGAARWPGHRIARDVATAPGGTGGYVLDGYGGLHAFGTAPRATGVTGYWFGWNIARAVAMRPDGTSGYVLDGYGGLHPFGGAPPMPVSRYTGTDTARDLVLNASGTGGWMMDDAGRLWPVGDADPVRPSMTWTGLNLGRAVSLAP